jgi:hypothetical protein
MCDEVFRERCVSSLGEQGSSYVSVVRDGMERAAKMSRLYTLPTRVEIEGEFSCRLVWENKNQVES